MRFRERRTDPTNGSPRQRVAAQIREHRTRAGMSVTELADVVGYSKASMSRFETCDSPVPEELCPKLDAAFGTNGLFTALFEMLRGVRFPDRYLEYMDLEKRRRRRLRPTNAHSSEQPTPALRTKRSVHGSRPNR
ncbi:helix-turn-helix domain-containing protein [Embleya sp. NPDC020886]|uniref:helix-turn-helix domain-containing protein n=1 Tax=Embleya sp. NPDC020886 TaxID=3363980 RepID=UPI003793E77F